MTELSVIVILSVVIATVPRCTVPVTNISPSFAYILLAYLMHYSIYACICLIG